MKRRFDLAAPGDLLLQRKLSAGDASKWRTVIRFPYRAAPQVQKAAELLYAADSRSLWRVVDGAHPMQVLAQWDGASWALA